MNVLCATRPLCLRKGYTEALHLHLLSKNAFPIRNMRIFSFVIGQVRSVLNLTEDPFLCFLVFLVAKLLGTFVGNCGSSLVADDS